MFRLTRENWFAVMGDRPTKDLWGIGSRISERLAGLGIKTVLELARTPDEPLIAEFGPNTGPHIGRLGRGVSSNLVDDTPWVARAHGRETTYQQNLVTADEVGDAIRSLAAPGGRGHPRRGARVPPGAPQGPLRAVLHRQPLAQAARAHVRGRA